MSDPEPVNPEPENPEAVNPDPVNTIDDYIATFPEDVQVVLERIREQITNVVPNAQERIRYGMPAIMLGNRYAIHFAGWKKHAGLYPVARLDSPLEEEIAPYRSAKDSVTFPYNKPIPYELIGRVAAALQDMRSGPE